MKNFLPRLVALLLLLPISLVHATDKKKTPAKPATTRFEIFFPKEVNATPLDGHIVLVLANNDNDEPRYQVSFMTAKSQQMFGIDVDALAPGSSAVIDASTLGYPADSLNDILAGDYWVQAVLNIYDTFRLGNGRTLKLPPDKGEGQHWQTKPGNLFSKPEKIHFDPKSPQIVKLSLKLKNPTVEQDPTVADRLTGWSAANDEHKIVDNKWVKHIRIQSDLLSKFWGRPTYLGAVIILPDGWDEHPNAHYPVIVLSSRSTRTCRFSYYPSERRTEGRRTPNSAERIQALSGLDRWPTSSLHPGHDPARDTVLRRFLCREFRERRSVWRRDHQGINPVHREDLPRDQPGLGTRGLRRIHGWMGKSRIASFLSGFL
jgi:hypothetical protein